jgi:hypothetical protein
LSFDDKPTDEFMSIFTEHTNARNPENRVVLEKIDPPVEEPKKGKRKK